MFEMSTDRRRPPRFGELQRYLGGLEGYVDRLIKTAPDRAKAKSLADTVAQRLSAMAETIEDGAARATDRARDDVSRYADRAVASGRDSLAVLAKEISANPLVAVGAALGVGLVIGAALLRSAHAPGRKPVRRTRAVRRVRKGSRT
jgi:ElaB/YqjD/DUF883 family membrane-anchored ribosome-binding protein